MFDPAGQSSATAASCCGGERPAADREVVRRLTPMAPLTLHHCRVSRRGIDNAEQARTAPVAERSVARLPQTARRWETQRKHEPFLSFVAVAATRIRRLELRKGNVFIGDVVAPPDDIQPRIVGRGA